MVILDIRKFGITTRWEIQIEKLNCPNNITDLMTKGPFSFFRHERFFTPINDNKNLDERDYNCTPTFGFHWCIIFSILKKRYGLYVCLSSQSNDGLFFRKMKYLQFTTPTVVPLS